MGYGVRVIGLGLGWVMGLRLGLESLKIPYFIAPQEAVAPL